MAADPLALFLSTLPSSQGCRPLPRFSGLLRFSGLPLFVFRPTTHQLKSSAPQTSVLHSHSAAREPLHTVTHGVHIATTHLVTEENRNRLIPDANTCHPDHNICCRFSSLVRPDRRRKDLVECCSVVLRKRFHSSLRYVVVPLLRFFSKIVVRLHAARNIDYSPYSNHGASRVQCCCRMCI